MDLPLIRRAASTGKPVLISSGMASQEELADAVESARSSGNGGVILLKCTTDYPADASDANLLTLPDMRERFGVEVGLSDHTPGVGVAVASVAMGAVVIEKHFTLSRSDGGVDAAFSLEPPEMKTLVEETHRAWNALGRVSYGPSESEKKNLRGRRSLYITADLRAGEALSRENVRSIRPGLGLAPKHFDEVLGKRVKKDIARGTPLAWDLLE